MYNGAQKFTEGDEKAAGVFAVAFAIFAAVLFLTIALIVGIKAGNFFFKVIKLYYSKRTSSIYDLY